jgi:hypothetical protein
MKAGKVVMLIASIFVSVTSLIGDGKELFNTIKN